MIELNEWAERKLESLSALFNSVVFIHSRIIRVIFPLLLALV